MQFSSYPVCSVPYTFEFPAVEACMCPSVPRPLFLCMTPLSDAPAPRNGYENLALLMGLCIMRIILIIINKKITRASQNLNKCYKSNTQLFGIMHYENWNQETNT